MPDDPGQIGVGSFGSQYNSPRGQRNTPVTKISAAVKTDGLAGMAKTFDSILKSTTGILRNIKALNAEGRTGGSAWARFLSGGRGTMLGQTDNNSLGWMSSLPPMMQTVGGYQAGRAVATQQQQQGRAPGTSMLPHLNLPPMLQTPGYQPPGQPPGQTATPSGSMPWMARITGLAGRVGTTAVAAAPAAALAGAAMLSGRIGQQIVEGAPISSMSMLTASMYSGARYNQIERERFRALGQFAGTRQDVAVAGGMAQRFGGTYAQTNQFLQGVGTTVQAMGGTMSAPEVVQATGSFLDPIALRRQISSGMRPAREAGQVRNPMEVAQDYVRNYEQKFNGGRKLNEFDFINIGTPGTGMRVRFQRLYGLDDQALDMIVVAGMQTVQAGGSLNYNSSAALSAAGLTGERLGLAAASLTTTQGVRNANYMANIEGGMVNRLQMEETIQETLGKLEDATGGLIEQFASLDRVVKILTTGMMAMGGLSMFGGGGGGMFGRGGVVPGVGGIAPAANIAGAQGGNGGMGGMGFGGRAMMGATGALLAAGGLTAATRSQNYGDIFQSMGASVAGGAMTGGSMFGVPGAIVGGLASGALHLTLGAFGVQGAENEQTRAEAASNAANLTDKQLLDKIKAPGPNDNGAPTELIWDQEPNLSLTKEGMYDKFQNRRAALIFKFMENVRTTDPVGFQEFMEYMATSQGEELAKVTDDWSKISTAFRDFSTAPKVDDADYIEFGKQFNTITEYIRQRRHVTKYNSGPAMQLSFLEYFGSVNNPMRVEPILTDPAIQIIGEYGWSASQGAAPTPADTGDAVFATLGDNLRLGDNTHGGLTPTEPFNFGTISNLRMAPEPDDPNWSKMDPRMRQRLRILFAASGGQVKWAKGGGWRSTEAQRAMFLDRYRPDPNGSISWNGQKWKHVKGAAAAPPGRSYHEIGLAADLGGSGVSNGWLRKNARKYGLKEFSSVNDEPWHVQLIELPNSRSEYDQGGDTGEAGTATSAVDTPKETGGTGGGGGAGSGLGGGTSLGLLAQGTSSLATLLGGGGGGGSYQGTGGATTADKTANVPWTGGVLTGAQIAQMAYNAGFRGENLVKIIGIAKRESGWNPLAHNTNANTGDNSYGLTQINMLGDLGPARQRQFGISEYDELLNPNTNLKAAYNMSGGTNFHAWLGYRAGLSLSDENMAAARDAVKSANLGDAVFDSGHGVSLARRSQEPVSTFGQMMMSGGGRQLNVNVTIQSNGNYAYDAQRLAKAARPAFEAEYAEVSMKRSM